MKTDINILPNQKIIANVKYIVDGDTIILNYQGKEFLSLARWIDAPETKKSNQFSNDPQILKHWQWGDRAKQFLIDLIQGQSLIVKTIEVDQYDRWICDWYLHKIIQANNLQFKLCLAGMCANSLPFQQYKFSNSTELSLYVKILKNCADAYKNKRGFWAESDFILPYQFKKLML